MVFTPDEKRFYELLDKVCRAATRSISDRRIEKADIKRLKEQMSHLFLEQSHRYAIDGD